MEQVAGHFGEWLQGRLGPAGPVALLTVHCPDLLVSVEVAHAWSRSLDQDPEILSAAQVAHVLDAMEVSSGRYALRTTIPPGGGAGASTASILALALAAGCASTQIDRLAALCLAVEHAVDPLMLPEPDSVLWASREARILRPLPRPFSTDIVGGFWGVPVRTDAADTDFDDVTDLVDAWSVANTLSGQAAIATSSSERCARLRERTHDPTADLARDLGALGHLRAHTGSARGLIFPPGGAPNGAVEALQEAGFRHALQFRTGRAK